MTTRQELEKMVEVEVMREFNGTNCTASNRNAFLYGADFVMDKLMPEIEKLNETNEESIDRAFQAEKNAALIAVEYTKIGCQLTAANERIKELENECSRLSDCCHLLDSSLRRLLKQPFHGSWDAQSVYIQHILHEARNWKALTHPERGEE